MSEGDVTFRPIHRVQPAIPRGGEDACRAVTRDGDLPGHHRFCSADPFGNRLEFLQPHAG